MANKELTLKNDVIFKEFFSKEGNEKYLQDFLTGLLEINITKIEIQRDVSLERLSAEEKLGVLDIQAVVDNKTIISIEMQMYYDKSIVKRSGFYSAKKRSSDAKKGDKYSNLRDIIMVNILNFNINPYKEYLSKGITVLEQHRKYELETGISYYYIELPKFRKIKPDMEKKLEQWLVFIDNKERGLIEMAKEKNEVIKEAEKELEYLTGVEEVKRMAFLHEKWEMDYNSGIENAREDGIKRGRKEGEKIGIKKEKREIAKKMLKQKIDIQIIIDVTGLTREEIEKL